MKQHPSQYLCLLQRNMSITICVKWSGKEYEVTELAATDTVETLKVGWKYEWNSLNPVLLGENHGEDWGETRETEVAESEGNPELCLIILEDCKRIA